MWSLDDDVILSAATYYISTKISNKSTIVNPKCGDPPQFQLDETDCYSKQCGQIFITINRSLVFHCAFCNNEYGTLFNFLQHISAQHLHGENETESEINTAKDDYTEKYTKLQPAQERLSLEFSSETYVANKPSPNERTKDKPALESVNEERVEFEKSTEKEPVDFDAGYQDDDETVESSIDAEKPIKKRQSNKKIKTAIHCDKCDKVFSHKAVLKSHLISHSTTRNYSCIFCERTFKHKCNLTQHIIRHTNEKNYKCDLCDKRFFTNIEATIHKRRHAEDRPHVCFKCGEAFKSTSNLFQHMRRRHDNVRSAKCDICERTRTARLATCYWYACKSNVCWMFKNRYCEATSTTEEFLNC